MENLIGQGKASTDSRQFVTFTLAEETFGVDIAKIQEIIGFQGVTPIPNQPAYLPGVINLRGAVVPVIDLRLRFGFPAKDHDRYTVVLILSLDEHLAGLIVDSVSDVVAFTPDDIQPAPRFSENVHAGFIESVGRQGDRFIILLDADKVIDVKELAGVEQIG